MTSGLVHEIDAKVTVRGRQKRVTFPHKLFMDYLAAWYLCKQNMQESLKRAFPTWDDVKKHKEVVKTCCGLMKGREEVIAHIVNVFKVAIMRVEWENVSIFHVFEYDIMSRIQEECKTRNPHFAVYPLYGCSLSQLLNTAKLVVIRDLTGEEHDAALPCNAEIIIDIHSGRWDRGSAATGETHGVMGTLQRHRDHIIAIYLEHGRQDVMDHVTSLLPSPSLECLYTDNCYIPKEVVNSLAQMPQLTFVKLHRLKSEGETLHGDLLVNAIKAWNGRSKLQVLNLANNYLPVSVCCPLLVAIAANCPCLEVLDMSYNTLSGCLAGFLQNPPPAHRKLEMRYTDLKAEDIESLATAVTEGNLQCLEKLIMNGNILGGCLAGLLQNPPPALRELDLWCIDLQAEDIESLAAAVRAGKLQHLDKLDTRGNNLSVAAVTLLLHALLNTMGDRKLKLYLGEDREGITIAPREHQPPEHYLEKITDILSFYAGSISLREFLDRTTEKAN